MNLVIQLIFHEALIIKTSTCMYTKYQPRYEKAGFLHIRKQVMVTLKLISAFVFTIRIVKSLWAVAR